MIYASAFPGLAGPAQRGFLGSGVAVPAPPGGSFDFTLDTLAGVTSWGLNTIATVLLIGIDADDFELEIVETPGLFGDDTGLVGVNG